MSNDKKADMYTPIFSVATDIKCGPISKIPKNVQELMKELKAIAEHHVDSVERTKALALAYIIGELVAHDRTTEHVLAHCKKEEDKL